MIKVPEEKIDWAPLAGIAVGGFLGYLVGKYFGAGAGLIAGAIAGYALTTK